jgi:hypothetical protein
MNQLAEEGADEAAKRYLIPNRVVTKGVQLRLLRQLQPRRAARRYLRIYMWYIASRLPEVRGWAGAGAASASYASYRSDSIYIKTGPWFCVS